MDPATSLTHRPSQVPGYRRKLTPSARGAAGRHLSHPTNAPSRIRSFPPVELSPGDLFDQPAIATAAPGAPGANRTGILRCRPEILARWTRCAGAVVPAGAGMAWEMRSSRAP